MYLSRENKNPTKNKRGDGMKFYKVRQAECDFCKKLKSVVTQVDDIYICSDCVKEILNHCITNEKIVKTIEVENDR